MSSPSPTSADRRFCGRCGGLVEPGSTFCGVCGALADPQAAAQTPLLPPMQPATPFGGEAAPTVRRQPAAPPPPPMYESVEPTTLVPTIDAERPHRSRGPLLVGIALGLAVIAGAAAFLVLRGDDTDEAAAPTTTSRAAPDSAPRRSSETTPAVTTTAAPATTSPATTSPATAAPTVAPVPTPATTAVPAVTVAPPPTLAPTTAPPVVETTAPAPPQPVATQPPVTPRPAGPAVVPGDLNLSVSMTQPACDGQYITILASAVTPGKYADQVATVLDQRPGSAYLRTDQTCSSLRPDLDGNAIYVVYFGPFASKQAACDARALGPADAYVKVLDTTTPYTTPHNCA